MSAPTPLSTPRPTEPLDPAGWLDRYGDYLYRFAVGRLGRPDVAEELVQDTLLAAWRGRAKFRGGASERSWLTAILKRKVIDWLRTSVRERSRAEEKPVDEWLRKQFSSGGMWKSGPGDWQSDTPEGGVERQEFWQAVFGCTQKLPSRLRDVFVLWHLDEKPTEEVCKAAGVKTNNLWVMLHRARHRMWRCLTRNWYGLDPDERSERRDDP